MYSRTAIFGNLVKDFMRGVPLAVDPGTACSEVVRRMTAEKASSATVTDSNRHPVGIVTEQDITRRIAFREPPETPVEAVMTSPILTIAAGEYLYHAVGRMRRHGLRHMPVVDGDGALVGLLDLHDALTIAADRLIGQIDRLTHEGTREGLREVKVAQVELAEELFADNLPAPEIQALLTHVNNDIYRRVVESCLYTMAEEGWGEPPVPLSVIVMGSGGRGENYLSSDQDNGFILGDYPDSQHTGIDGFFIELAERMTHDLNDVGLPLCFGHCMAVNPLWRKTLSQWVAQIDGWGRRRNVVAIRLSDIFFDFQPVWGASGLARDLRRKVLDHVRQNHFFLQEMYRDEIDHNVALGLFGRFITVKDGGYRGQINLKHTGTIPLVEAVRLMALREGIEKTSTLERIETLHAGGILDANENEELTGAFTYITELLLRRQIADFKAGREIGHHIDPRILSRQKKKQLVEAFKAVDRLRQRVRSEFTAEIF